MTIFEGKSELLRLFRDGDRSALGKVYDFYVADVFRLVRFGFLLKGPPPFHVPGLAEPGAQQDAVHDIFLKAFSERARLAYDGLRPYRPFLLQIARNMRIDAERRRRSEHRADSSVVAADDGGEELDSSVATEQVLPLDEQLDWDRKRGITVGFIDALDAESKEFVRFRFVDELSQNDVAERMGISRRRARTLEGRVLAGLRKQLQKELLG